MRRRWRMYALVATPSLAVALAAAGPWATSGVHEPLRVLVVGNSRLYYHDQPAMLEALADANDRAVETRMIVRGGATLRDHVERGVLSGVRSGRWDAVVINEQSSWGVTRYVEGLPRVPPAPQAFYATLDSIARAAQAGGARLLLVAHPRYRDAPRWDGDLLIRGFAAAQDAHPELAVVPLETAWRIGRRGELDLYDPDGNHPNATGALLTAMSIYHALFGEAPVSVPARIRGAYVEEGDGVLHPDSIVELVEADPALRDVLREVVVEAAHRWPADVAEARAATPDPDLPRLPSAPARPPHAGLEGRWSGDLLLYPRFLTWPSTLSLDLAEDGGRWTAAFRLSFGGRPSDVVYPVLPVSDEGAYMQLVDPDGPNGSLVRYRFVPVGDSLSGIAEFVETDGVLYGIGSFTLHR